MLLLRCRTSSIVMLPLRQEVTTLWVWQAGQLHHSSHQACLTCPSSCVAFVMITNEIRIPAPEGKHLHLSWRNLCYSNLSFCSLMAVLWTMCRVQVHPTYNEAGDFLSLVQNIMNRLQADKWVACQCREHLEVCSMWQWFSYILYSGPWLQK